MPFEISVQFDRVGAQFFAGETVTGAVVVKTDSSTRCKSVVLQVRGSVDPKALASRNQQGIFEKLQEDLKPYVMLNISVPLGAGADGDTSLKFPEGTTELPFSFPLVGTTTLPNGTPVPLIETYSGVFISCRYEVKATVSFTFQSQTSQPAELFLVSPGQAEQDVFKINGSESYAFDFTSMQCRKSRKAAEVGMPDFHIVGSIDKLHIDIDSALSGFIRIVKCSVPITSVEIQLARSESCASELRQDKGREITEIQNIQIGDGDVLRGDWDIPIFMRFPRWYTSPAIRTPNLRVDVEVSLVVTFEGKLQVSQIIPIRLYRSSKKVTKD